MIERIVLINPNRYRDPPVIPIGLEYIKTSLERNGYNVEILDLCFEDKPIDKLRRYLKNRKPSIAGISVRNIDTSSYFTNEFFLPEIKSYISEIKKLGIPVIVGGSGFSAMPYEILRYLDADYGILGPAEKAIISFLKDWEKGQLKSKIYNGWEYGIDPDLAHIRGNEIDYETYMKNGGIIGFETQKGCYNKCPYCIEANKPVFLKNIDKIINELKHLISIGFNHFHLCDSEFNLDLNYALKFCRALIKESLNMKWALYMKPTPYNEELFKLLGKSNAYMITLSVDSYEYIQKLNGYTYKDLEKIIYYCRKYGIKLFIDLLCGYPNEPEYSIKKIIDFFRKHRPASVGITFYYRIYKNTELANIIKSNNDLHQYLTRKVSKDKEDFIEPIFFSNYDLEFFQNLIKDDELFRIAGLKKGVNYQFD